MWHKKMKVLNFESTICSDLNYVDQLNSLWSRILEPVLLGSGIHDYVRSLVNQSRGQMSFRLSSICAHGTMLRYHSENFKFNLNITVFLEEVFWQNCRGCLLKENRAFDTLFNTLIIFATMKLFQMKPDNWSLKTFLYLFM